MNKKKTKIFIITILSLSLIAIITGLTISAFKSKEKITNTFKAADVDVSIKEEFKPCCGDKKVWIENNTGYDCLIRVSITESWVDKNNNLVIQETPEGLATINFSADKDQNWIKGNDGYYYYKKILKANSKTENLTESVTFNYDNDCANKYEGFRFNVDVKAEAVQPNKIKDEAGDYYAFDKMWYDLDEEVRNELINIVDNN